MQRNLEIVLVIATLVGGVFLWRSAQQHAELTREYQRLAAKVGRLPVKDQTKVHILAMDTGDPQHFAWRAYFPANYHYSYTCSSGGGSGSSGEPWEGILRVRFREIDGQNYLYYRLLQGSGLRSIGSGKLYEVLKEHPDLMHKLLVEQIGARELVTFDPSEVKTLIKLSLPADLANEMVDKKGMASEDAQVEWIRLGPPGFREREETSGQ